MNPFVNVLTAFFHPPFGNRCLEDHENLLSVLCCWRPEAKNKLLFVPRPERYDVFRRPEKYLSPANKTNIAGSENGGFKQPLERLDQEGRQKLLQEAFYPASPSKNTKKANKEDKDVFEGPEGGSPTDIDGPLWLKSEGKKQWKKHHFFLRDSRLFHAARTGKKPSSVDDLSLLVTTFDAYQVYYGVGWRKKFKAPTDWCLAIKPPQIQCKSPKQIRYVMFTNSTRPGK